MKLRDVYTCPLELTHDMMKGKWKPIIVWRLRLGPTSLSKLEHDIEGISQKMLLEQLKELMAFSIVDKEVYEGYPLRVEYFLTSELGNEMLQALSILQKIGIHYMKTHGMEDVLEEKGIL
ncbi:winged helix-turn-helix transcriptional regulator [Amedibacillus sp. YH-ame6]